MSIKPAVLINMEIMNPVFQIQLVKYIPLSFKKSAQNAA